MLDTRSGVTMGYNPWHGGHHIPAVAELDRDPAEIIASGDWVKVDGDKGIVEVTKKD